MHNRKKQQPKLPFGKRQIYRQTKTHLAFKRHTFATIARTSVMCGLMTILPFHKPQIRRFENGEVAVLEPHTYKCIKFAIMHF